MTKTQDENNNNNLSILQCFTKGFQTLMENYKLICLHTAYYAPKAKAILNTLDTPLKINWPLRITERSSRYKKHVVLTSYLLGVSI